MLLYLCNNTKSIMAYSLDMYHYEPYVIQKI